MIIYVKTTELAEGFDEYYLNDPFLDNTLNNGVAEDSEKWYRVHNDTGPGVEH